MSTRSLGFIVLFISLAALCQSSVSGRYEDPLLIAHRAMTLQQSSSHVMQIHKSMKSQLEENYNAIDMLEASRPSRDVTKVCADQIVDVLDNLVGSSADKSWSESSK